MPDNDSYAVIFHTNRLQYLSANLVIQGQDGVAKAPNLNRFGAEGDSLGRFLVGSLGCSSAERGHLAGA